MKVLSALLMFAAGLITLAAVWLFAFMASVRVLGLIVGYEPWFHCTVGLVLIPLLFWGNATTDWQYLEEYRVRMGPGPRQIVSFFLPIPPKYAASPAADLLYVGPRLITTAARTVRKAFRLLCLDVDGCASVISLLKRAGSKMSFQEIADAVPQIHLSRVFRQLLDIHGVLLLRGEPAGLVLGSKLKAELQKVL